MPVFLLLLFGYTLSLDPDHVRLAVEDLDQTPLSRSYVDAFTANGEFELVSSSPLQPAVDLISRGVAEVGLTIPPGFTRDLRSGRDAQTQVLLDGTDSNTALVLRQNVRAIHANFLRELSGEAPPGAVAQIRYWYNPGLSDAKFFGTGALGMVLIFFPALLGAIASSREHELGGVVQVYASKLTPLEWTLGQAALYVGVGLIELVLAFAAGVAAFGYELRGSLAVFVLASFFYIAAGVFFGILVGNIARNQNVSMQVVQMGIILLSLLLSGYLAPLKNIPEGIRWMSTIIPARYYVPVVRDVLLRGGGWSTVWWETSMLALLAAIPLALNWRVVRKMQLVQ